MTESRLSSVMSDICQKAIYRWIWGSDWSAWSKGRQLPGAGAVLTKWTEWNLAVAVHCYDDSNINIVESISITIISGCVHSLHWLQRLLMLVMSYRNPHQVPHSAVILAAIIGVTVKMRGPGKYIKISTVTWSLYCFFGALGGQYVFPMKAALAGGNPPFCKHVWTIKDGSTVLVSQQSAVPCIGGILHYCIAGHVKLPEGFDEDSQSRR